MAYDKIRVIHTRLDNSIRYVMNAEKTIDGVSFDGSSNITHYGSCSTAAATAAKTVSVGSGTVTLEAGLRVTVKFTYANTAGTPTLNVNSKGAKNIYHKGSQITTGSNKALLAGKFQQVELFLEGFMEW